MTASGGLNTLPRLFDTANPGGEGGFGDPDLGAPNERCQGGGPGIGEGGEPDGAGPNCSPLGNVLIVQENNKKPWIPDDNGDGGKIVMNFEPKAESVSTIGLLDVDYRTTLYIRYMDDGGVMRTKVSRIHEWNCDVWLRHWNDYSPLILIFYRLSKSHCWAITRTNLSTLTCQESNPLRSTWNALPQLLLWHFAFLNLLRHRLLLPTRLHRALAVSLPSISPRTPRASHYLVAITSIMNGKTLDWCLPP